MEYHIEGCEESTSRPSIIYEGTDIPFEILATGLKGSCFSLKRLAISSGLFVDVIPDLNGEFICLHLYMGIWLVSLLVNRCTRVVKSRA